MPYVVGYIAGVLVVLFIYLALIAVRVVLWAGIFWFGAWLFPGLDVMALDKLGVSFATVGAGVGLLMLAASGVNK